MLSNVLSFSLMKESEGLVLCFPLLRQQRDYRLMMMALHPDI